MPLSTFIQQMPKVELHVHLEGAIHPSALLELAQKHNITLPADSVEELRKWYRFTDFPHFVDIYTHISSCIRSAEDIELVARDFIEGQAKQNIRYTEVTYTPYTHYVQKGLPFEDQLAALHQARQWGEQTLGVQVNYVIDIAREVTAEEGCLTAEWAISGMDRGVVALGLGGYEVGNPPEKFVDAFSLANEAGLPAVPHAGETAGPESIWGAIRSLDAVRIGHGVRCLEDPALVEKLREKRIPLEVCPTSNVCLGIASSIQDHPLPTLVAEGLYVTINSDDPPLFNTTLTDEYSLISDAFGYDESALEAFVMNAVEAALLDEEDKTKLRQSIQAEFARLKREE